MSIDEKVDEFFDGVTRGDFIKLLTEAGFEVENGNGRVIDENGNDITEEILKHIK